MTEFRVLPIRKGDAFLLRSARGGYLVNGGGFDGGLPDLLNERGARKLRAAVCTSAAAEALGGLLELMRSGQSVGEYWLPEGLCFLPELAVRFNGDLAGWIDLAALGRTAPPAPRTIWPLFALERNRRLLGAAALFALALAAYRGSWRDVLPERYGRGPGRYFLLVAKQLLDADPEQAALLQSLPEPLLGGLREADLALLAGRLLLSRFDKGGEENQASNPTVVRTLVLSAMTTALIDLTGVRRRSFRAVGRLTDHLVARHPLMCLNGLESAPLPGLGHTIGPEAIFRLAAELGRPDQSLVFRYGDAACGALFLGDSKLQFLRKGESLRLDRPTVVAAPGQGSCRQEQAYAHIESGRPAENVWVRGYLPRARKAASGFCRQEKVLCLNDCRTAALREIFLRFRDGAWREAGRECRRAR